MTKDDVTPYDLACFMALQGVLASGTRIESWSVAVRSVDALFVELAKKQQSGQWAGEQGPWKNK